MNESTPTVAAVLVNFRAPDLVRSRVRELSDGGVRCIVVDNSGDMEEPECEVIDAGANVGFGVACNLGVTRLGVDIDIVCLHNPDVVAPIGAIRTLAARAHAIGGAVAPALSTSTGLRAQGFHYPSLAREAFLSGRGTHSRSEVKLRARPVEASAEPRGRTNHRFGSAALLAVTRDAYLDVGGFDDRYFMYVEDLDLWHRLRIAGWACRFAPDLVADHAEKGGSEMSVTRRELLRWLGVELFAELHGRAPWQAYRLIHRMARRRLRETGELGTWVDERWRRGDRPSTVLAAVREHLEQPALSFR